MNNVTLNEREILEKLNSEYLKTSMGAIVFVASLMMIGCIGNLHVLIVFGLRIKPSNNRTFILCLGIIDMVGCAIGMPFTINTLIHQLTFYDMVSCKMVIGVNYFVCACSGLIHIVISVDRYRKICHPMGWQLSHKMAKLTCILTICVAATLSLPAFFIFGHNSFSTIYQNVTGSHCSTDDKFVATAYPTIFNLVLITLATVGFIAMAVLYTLINRVIWNRGQQKSLKKIKTNIKRKQNYSSADAIVSVTKFFLSCGSQSIDSPERYTTFPTPTQYPGSLSKTRIKMNLKNQDSLIKNKKRMTVIFLVLIAAYFCSYVPSLVLKIIAFLNYDYFRNLTRSKLAIYTIFSCFFFLNNIVNAIVYLFLDVKFRAELKLFYGNCVKKFRKIIFSLSLNTYQIRKDT